jgi:hypothetical protein
LVGRWAWGLRGSKMHIGGGWDVKNELFVFVWGGVTWESRLKGFPWLLLLWTLTWLPSSCFYYFLSYLLISNILFIWIVIKYYIVCLSIYLLVIIYFSFWPVAVSWLAIFSTAFCIYGMCTTCSAFLIGCVCSVFSNTKDKNMYFCWRYKYK